MHHKVFLVDDCLAAVGTANLDNRSFKLNFEMMVAVIDKDFNFQMAQMFEEDFRECSREELERFDKLPFHIRIGAKLARLCSPIL